jgi:hypothetical protein
LDRARRERARARSTGVRRRRATLGAGTKLTEDRGDRPDAAAEGERAVALVSVAVGRPLDASAATHVRRALAKAREGDAPPALTHLALAGASRLDEPQAPDTKLPSAAPTALPGKGGWRHYTVEFIACGGRVSEADRAEAKAKLEREFGDFERFRQSLPKEPPPPRAQES